MNKTVFTLSMLLSNLLFAQDALTVERIMRDPKWMGGSPHHFRWSPDSKSIYFLWNHDQDAADSLFYVTLPGNKPVMADRNERRIVPTGDFQLNRNHTLALFEKYGDIFLMDIDTKKIAQITSTNDMEFNPVFSGDEKRIFYTTENNLFSWEIATGKISQWTDFRKGKKITPAVLSEQEKWIRDDQLNQFEALRSRDEKQNLATRTRKKENPIRPKEVYLDDKNVDLVRISADQKYILFRLSKTQRAKYTIVPNYLTISGFTEDINSRTKVGSLPTIQELYCYDIARDTVLQIRFNDLPGISDPALKNTKEESKGLERQINFTDFKWSPDGKRAAIVVRSVDNKDRWIAMFDPSTQKLTCADRLHDNAWINFGTVNGYYASNFGWLDNKQFWFLSEESGFSHLYTVDIFSGKKNMLTKGSYEVQRVVLPDSKTFFYFVTNQQHPGEKHVYRMPVTGGRAEKITSMPGAYEMEISPDEKNIALRYSYTNRPWELFVIENKSGAKARQITWSLTEEFQAYPWRDPKVVTFKARDSATVYARLYKPQKPNGAGVIFVHGAGYLQNAHRWWSEYYREYMFNNLLCDRGFTILDIDYRASAGYGRDWRTGIYQFMGGKDLNDNLDGAQYLIDEHGVDPERLGIYGGSYGGFITLMAMFTAPDVFAAGAALRPVTDWAHYNHSYTSNVLNTPVEDSLAYAKSSPIYYAENLKGSLLICHGMIDINVHFQDVVRLTQRLIELKKENWELAVYPVEDHAFNEATSWTDEYKRILKLFDIQLMKEGTPPR